MQRTGAAFVIAVLSAACAAPAPPAAPGPPVATALPPVTLPTGRVIEYGTLGPIPGAVVSFRFLNAGAQPIASAVTDATGGYRVDLAPGEYRVAVDDVDVAVLTVRPDTAHGDIIARFGNCSATYGYVMDAATGARLAEAVVKLTVRQATTSSRGWYLFDFGCDLPIGGNTTFIDFTREGYTRQTLIYGRGVRGMRRFDAALVPE